MISHQFSEGELIIGKLGTNPWWPGAVVQCQKTNNCYVEVHNIRKVFVNFFEIDIDSWIDANNILKCSSRQDLEQYLSTAQQTSSNVKYMNSIPSAMMELYNRAWQKFDKLQDQQISAKQSSELSKMEIIKVQSVASQISRTTSQLSACEICLKRNIEFECGEKNRFILELSADKQRQHFSQFMVDDSSDDGNVESCSNQCKWRYHKRCCSGSGFGAGFGSGFGAGTDNNDMVCSCNKSVWLCSICDDAINVAQLFVCDNDKCMRSYHRSCLSTHLEMSPDTKQCPLHRCINCSLDHVAHTEDGALSPQSDLVTCVKCKLAFHNHPDCLPAICTAVTSNLIICQRHLNEPDRLMSNTSSFCFTCSTAISDNPMSCKYCLVTYHRSAPCLPGFIEPIDENTFICNGCKFPYVRRGQGYVLAIPADIVAASAIGQWKLGVLCGVDINAMGQKSVVIKEENGKKSLHEVHRIISVNLQSLDHLTCFGVHRFQDLQIAIKHHAKLVERICSTFGGVQNLYRNSFVLKYSGLFPLAENFHADLVSPTPVPVQAQEKCACSDCCTTNRCPNVAASTECTPLNCGSLPRCRNRRLQKRHYPRYRLVVDENHGDPHLVLEETVVKDVLVSEWMGAVKSASWAATNAGRACLNLSQDAVLDWSQLCSPAIFLKQSDRPNLQPRIISVSGFPRIGLFSIRRIVKGDTLSVDLRPLYRDPSVVPTSNLTRLTTWQQTPEILAQTATETPDELFVIDLCNDDNDCSQEQSCESFAPLPPLCAECLRELTIDPARGRVLVHCRVCFSVLHFRCAFSVMKRNLSICNDGQHDERILDFICQFCTSLME